MARGTGEDFVWVKVRDVTYVSVYSSPNELIADFEHRNSRFEDALRDSYGKNRPIVLTLTSDIKNALNSVR